MTIATTAAAPRANAAGTAGTACISTSTATSSNRPEVIFHTFTCYQNLFSTYNYTLSRATAGVLTPGQGRPGAVSGMPGTRSRRGRVCPAPDRAGRPGHPGRPDSGRGRGPDSGAAPAARPGGRLAPRPGGRPGTRLGGGAPFRRAIRDAIPGRFTEFAPELTQMAFYFSRAFAGNGITGAIAGCRMPNPDREGGHGASGEVADRRRPAACPASRRGVSWL